MTLNIHSAVALTSRLSGTGYRTVRRWQSLRFAVSALYLHHNLPVYAFQQSELMTLEVMVCVSCLRRWMIFWKGGRFANYLLYLLPFAKIQLVEGRIVAKNATTRLKKKGVDVKIYALFL